MSMVGRVEEQEKGGESESGFGDQENTGAN